MTSRPSRAGGIALSWMGVRLRNWAAARLRCNAADKGSCENVVIRVYFFLEGLVVTHPDTRQEPSCRSHSIFGFHANKRRAGKAEMILVGTPTTASRANREKSVLHSITENVLIPVSRRVNHPPPEFTLGRTPYICLRVSTLAGDKPCLGYGQDSPAF